MVILSDRTQANNGHSAMLTDVEYAVRIAKIYWSDFQLPGHLKDVHRTQDNIIPIGTALTALITAEFESIVQTKCVVSDILKHRFFSCHMSIPP